MNTKYKNSSAFDLADLNKGYISRNHKINKNLQAGTSGLRNTLMQTALKVNVGIQFNLKMQQKQLILCRCKPYTFPVHSGLTTGN